MLCSSGYTASNIKLRCNDLAGLSNLMGTTNPLFFNRRSGGTYDTTADICQFLNQRKVFLAAHTTTAGYDNICIFQIDCLTDLFYHIGNLCKYRLLRNFYCFFYNFAGFSRLN